MKYSVVGDNNYLGNLQEEFFKNKGIHDVKEFLDPKYVHYTHWSEFKNMDSAVECFEKHVENGSEILIIEDADLDGAMSTATLYNYLSVYYDNMVHLSVHEKKTHGIIMSEIEEYLGKVKLIFIPDAGSQDFKQHSELKKRGIDVIVLDHHQCPKYSKNAIVVNNQMSDIAHDFCGATMVYKFLQALDDKYGNNGADDYLDLVAVGMIGDMVDVRRAEVQSIIRTGLSNIQNEMLKSILEAQSFSTKGKQNQQAIGFYVAPLVNAVMRISDVEETKQILESFCDIGSDKKYYYTPSRGGKKGEMLEETVYQNTTRTIKSVKGKQDRIVEKITEGSKRPPKMGLFEYIELNYKVDKILILDISEFVENDLGLTGLVANKIMYKYNKPTILLMDKGDGFYIGSGRCGQFENFRKKLSDSNLITAEGHESAFGVRLQLKENETVKDVSDRINEYFENEDFVVEHKVDFAIPFEFFEDWMIEDLYQLEDYWGHGINQPKLYVENINVPTSNVKLGTNGKTITFNVNDIEYILFNKSPDYFDTMVDWSDTMCYNIVGKPNVNEFNGERYPQIIVDDIEVLNKQSEEDKTTDDLEDDEWETTKVGETKDDESDDFEW